MESRFRRVQQVAPPSSGRVLPGMPLDTVEPDGEASPRLDRPRFDGPRRPWWRPASRIGRVFLTIGALIVLGGLTASAIALKTYISRDSRFRVGGAANIEASGLTEVSRADMLPVFGEDIGRNIFFVPLSERRKQLEQIPWIEHATVMRLLPDQIRISVTERRPVAFVRERQQIGLVDVNGVLLTMPAAMMAQHHYSFPVVTGIDAGDPLASRKARMTVYERLLGELDANGQHLSEQISEIDLTDPEDARVSMPEQGADILAHFGEDHFLERYQRYKAHIAEWRQQYPKLAAVDLRYEQQVVLEMASGTSAAQPATPDASGSNPASAEAKPDTANAGQANAGQPNVRQVNAGQAGQGQGNSAEAKTPAAAKTKPSKAVTAAAKAKAAAQAREKKKRADARRAVLNVNRQKTAPKPHPAPIAEQGQ